MLSQAPGTMAFKLAWPAVAVLFGLIGAIYLVAIMAAVDSGYPSLSATLPLACLSALGTAWLVLRLAGFVTCALVALGMMLTVRRAVSDEEDLASQEEAWN